MEKDFVTKCRSMFRNVYSGIQCTQISPGLICLLLLHGLECTKQFCLVHIYVCEICWQMSIVTARAKTRTARKTRKVRNFFSNFSSSDFSYFPCAKFENADKIFRVFENTDKIFRVLESAENIFQPFENAENIFQFVENTDTTFLSFS